MIVLEPSLRFAIALLLAFAAVLVSRDRSRLLAARLAATFALGIAAHALLAMPGLAGPDALVARAGQRARGR